MAQESNLVQVRFRADWHGRLGRVGTAGAAGMVDGVFPAGALARRSDRRPLSRVPYYGGGYYPYYDDDYGYPALPYGYPAHYYGYAPRILSRLWRHPWILSRPAIPTVVWGG